MATDPVGGGGGSPPGSVVMFDPRTPGGGGGTAQIAAPREGVTAWTGASPLSPKAVPQSVPIRVSVVLVEETPGRSARKLPSTPNSGKWRTIAGAVSPTGVADIVDSVMLPTIAGAAPPADVAKVFAADAASLTDAGILFPADPVGVVAVGVAAPAVADLASWRWLG